MPTVSAIEEIPFRDALTRMDWTQGEHITLIGPTGRGKTELTIHLLAQMDWFVFLGTKRIDSTQTRLKRELGCRVIADPAELNADLASRFILRPPFPRHSDAEQVARIQRRVFKEGILTAFYQTGWTIAIDEAKYICHNLGLKGEAELVWLQGRSQGNSVIASTQRSRFVPLEAYDMATHLFMWTDPDLSNVKRNAELAGFNRNAVLDAMQIMTKHDVLYVNTVTQDMFITNTRWE